jgi:hypothetical protein
MRTIYLGCDKDFRRGAWLAGGRSFLMVLPSYQNHTSFLDITKAPSSFLQHRVVSPIFAVNGPRVLHCAIVSDLTHPAGFALFIVPRIPTKQVTSKTINHESCGTNLWRWVPADLRAVEVWISNVWTGGRKHILMIHRQISRRLV